MKTLTRLGRIFSRACVYFTVATLALYTGGMLVSGIEHEWIPTLKMMYIVFVFSLLFSAVNQLVLPAKWSGVLKLLVHYPLSLLIFYVLFIVWGGYTASASSVLILLVFFTLLYAAGALIRMLILHTRSAVKSSATSYDQQFTEQTPRK